MDIGKPFFFNQKTLVNHDCGSFDFTIIKEVEAFY